MSTARSSEQVPEQDVRTAGVPRQRATGTTEPDERSTGRLLSEITHDLQTLFRQEVALAKTELRQEMSKSTKSAGMLGGAGFAAYMVVVLLSFAAVFGLGALIGLGWSALIVAAVWAVIGGVLFLVGRSRMRTVSVKPERTIDSLKEDAEWARHPTR